MKKKYIPAEIEIIEFDSEDIITDSSKTELEDLEGDATGWDY